MERDFGHRGPGTAQNTDSARPDWRLRPEDHLLGKALSEYHELVTPLTREPIC